MLWGDTISTVELIPKVLVFFILFPKYFCYPYSTDGINPQLLTPSNVLFSISPTMKSQTNKYFSLVTTKGRMIYLPSILSKLDGSVTSDGKFAIFSLTEASWEAECSSSVNFLMSSSGWPKKTLIS